MVVKVNQQHVRDEAHNKPNRRFHNSLKSHRHQARIRQLRIQCKAFRLAPSGAVAARIDSIAGELGLQRSPFQA
jgi:hypothetical protein